MNFEEFSHIVKNTRCIRRFKQNITIEKNELLELIDLARQTSSAMNLQPLKYIPIVDEEIKAKVYKPLKWAARLTDWEQSEDERPAAYILILNDTAIEGSPLIDGGIAMQTIMLGARIKGYGSCILASIDKDGYKKIFNLDENLEPMFIIALGAQNEKIELVEAKNDTGYYRKNGTHCVPKRALKEVVVE